MSKSAALVRPAARLLYRLSYPSAVARRGLRTFAIFVQEKRTPSSSWLSPPSACSVRSYRREPISQAQVMAEMEEEAKNIDLAPHKLLQKGETGTVQAIIKDVIPVGYFVTMPSGKEAYLPAQDLGFTGGLAILERLFKVGQEITVRVASIGGGGREILSIKKPEHAPPERKFTISTDRKGSTGSRY